METKEKLTEIIGNVVVNDKGNRIRDVFHPEFVQKIVEDLIKHDTIVPPCKVGDTLYVISQMKDKRILPFVNEYEATYIQVGKRKCKVYHEKDGFIKIFLQDDFGKTVFLTKEEAEAALKEKGE